MTSEPSAPARSVPVRSAVPPAGDRAARRLVYSAWAVLTVAGLFFVATFPQNGPIIDEWEFVPALLGEEPFWPWLWKLHNEHRFPLPRAIYYTLFHLTHDFRTGCFVSLAGMSGLALGMVELARRLRGRVAWSDAFFPISLLHWGHYENFLMGYQICFMLVPVLAGGLLAVILRTCPTSLFRRGIEGGLLTLALLLCGAGGLAFGPPGAVWLLALAARLGVSSDHRRLVKSGILVLLAAVVCAYIGIYFAGYARPDYHPPCPGVGAALVVALQALSMAFGPAAIGVWPEASLLRPIALAAVALTAVVAGCIATMALVRWAFSDPEARPRALGLLLVLGAVGAEAFGIGWGRSGFVGDDGVCRMGLAARYSWIVWPGLAALYFLGVCRPDGVVTRRLPGILAVLAAVTLPANMVTGLEEARKRQAEDARWAADVRADLSPDELVERYHPNWPAYLQDRIHVGVRLLREHRIGYYTPVTEPHRGPGDRPVPGRDSGSAP